MAESYPTRPRSLPLQTWQRLAWGRRFLVLLFAIPVIGALVGLVGLRTADVTSESAGYELRVHYAEVARAGIASPLDIYVHHEGGFDSPIRLNITHDYFALFDLNGVYPAPSAEFVEGDKLVWEFDPPEGDELRVHVDWRVQPSRHRGTAAAVELQIDEALITDVRFNTRLAP